jgi:hypothetical protein
MLPFFLSITMARFIAYPRLKVVVRPSCEGETSFGFGKRESAFSDQKRAEKKIITRETPVDTENENSY